PETQQGMERSVRHTRQPSPFSPIFQPSLTIQRKRCATLVTVRPAPHATMNYSEKLALEYVEKTRRLMSDPTYLMADWSSTIMTIAVALLLFVCVQLIVE